MSPGIISSLLLGLALTGCAGTDPAPEPAAQERPNFIVIFTDDQRHDAVGFAGNELIHTPNLDALAERGVRFSNAFVALSICSPSRAALLTGRYGSENGVVTLAGELDEDERTIPQYLKEAGYRTAHVGKWHLDQPPEALGFDFAPYFVSNGTYYNRTVFEEGRKTTAEGFIEDYSARQAVRFLEGAARSGEPFLLMLNTQLPHLDGELEWNATEHSLARYDARDMPVPVTWNDDLSGKPPYLREARNRQQALTYGYDDPARIRQHKKEYYAVITDMDAALGRVLEAVDRLDLRGNTYLLFMSDNGWFVGEHGFTSKVLPYEASIRVPLAIAGPGLDPGVEARFALNVDIAPTLLELAGVPVPERMHGRSLVPLLRGEPVEWRHRFLYEAPRSELGSWPLFAVRDERFKYVRTYDLNDPERVAFEELYDLRSDPHEMRNLARDGTHAAVLDRMSAELDRMRAELREAS